MKLSEAFPSNFLKADDLAGKPVTLTIVSATLEELGQGRDKEQKLILAFAKTEKKLVCNKTNATVIAKLYGDDTDGWVNQRIVLVPREVDFQGQTTWAIRVSLNKPGAAAATAVAEPDPQPDAPKEDDIPF